MATLTFIPTASSGGGSPFGAQITWQAGLALSEGGTILGPSDDAISVFAADARQLLLGGTTMTTDATPGGALLSAQGPYSRAATNTTGGSLSVLGSIGLRKITITDYTALGGHIFTLYVGSGATIAGTSLTEGAQWTAATSNNATATSLATAVSAIPGLTGTAVGAVVYVAHTTSVWSLAGQMDPDRTGAVMSFDALQASDGGTLPAGYLGGAVDGGILLGGSGSAKLSTVGVYEAANGDTTLCGFARVTSPGGSVGFDSCGLQFWPLDYADGYTDTSYTSLDIYQSATYGAYLWTEGVGATRAVPPLRIGTGPSKYGSDASGADLWFAVAGGDSWRVQATTSSFLPYSDASLDIGDASHQVRSIYASSLIVSGAPRFNATEGTGAGTVTIGAANSPATGTVAAWIPVKLSDGSTAYVAAWKP